MAITVANADVHFASHVDGNAWDDFTDANKARGVAHALRLVQTRGGSAFVDADTTISTVGARWDLAVYEQAFFMLSNSHIPRDGSTGAPRYLETDTDPADPQDVETLCNACLRYITGAQARYPNIEMRRG